MNLLESMRPFIIRVNCVMPTLNWHYHEWFRFSSNWSNAAGIRRYSAFAWSAFSTLPSSLIVFQVPPLSSGSLQMLPHQPEARVNNSVCGMQVLNKARRSRPGLCVGQKPAAVHCLAKQKASPFTCTLCDPWINKDILFVEAHCFNCFEFLLPT